MSIFGVPAALQEKNEQEFIKVTRRIQEALARIKDDPKLKATQDVLAQLADCSRGTINNRKWPLDRLREIKTARKAAKQPITDESTSTAKIESRIERYKERLYDSREEVLIWKARYDEVGERLAQAQNLNRVLQSRLEAVEQEISRLRSTPVSKVVELSPKLPK
jgi:chromosome segregation ATPase